MTKKKKRTLDDDKGFLGRLGPGLITGASDDDPSGIGTYSQAGAQLGFGIGWTMLLTYPHVSSGNLRAHRAADGPRNRRECLPEFSRSGHRFGSREHRPVLGR